MVSDQMKKIIGGSGIINMDNNLYVYGDVLFTSEFDIIEPEYVYINPTVYELKSDYLVVVNEDGSQLELIDKSSGLWVSKGITHDMELIPHIENILENCINSNE